MLYKEINIITSMSSTYSSWKYTIGLLKGKKLDLKKVVSYILPLSEYCKGFKKHKIAMDLR